MTAPSTIPPRVREAFERGDVVLPAYRTRLDDILDGCPHDRIVPCGDGFGRCVACGDDTFPITAEAAGDPPAAVSSLALEALGALHGPPPGNESTRRVFAFAATYERLRAEGEAARPRAVRVRVEGGPVLWERPPKT